jgi:hypothetical protein
VGLLPKEALMRFVNVAKRRFGIAGELLAFFWSNKRWWMVPMLAVLLILGALIVFAESSAVAPFIYALF